MRMDDVLTLDRRQLLDEMAQVDAQIAEGELRLRVLTAEVERLRGKRQVWVMLADALKERAD